MSCLSGMYYMWMFFDRLVIMMIGSNTNKSAAIHKLLKKSHKRIEVFKIKKTIQHLIQMTIVQGKGNVYIWIGGVVKK